MNNEIGRKLTSLTLMTIMLAGGMTIAAPSMMPQAAAAGALYVSAENAMFDNTFGGAQVVEVVVLGIATETDEKQGEPVVILPSVSDEDAKAKYPEGWDAPLPYLRIVPQPK